MEPIYREACDSCHKRKIRCTASASGACLNCRHTGRPCVYSIRDEMGRPRKGSRRRKKSPLAHDTREISPPSTTLTTPHDEATDGSSWTPSLPHQPDLSRSDSGLMPISGVPPASWPHRSSFDVESYDGILPSQTTLPSPPYPTTPEPLGYPFASQPAVAAYSSTSLPHRTPDLSIDHAYSYAYSTEPSSYLPAPALPGEQQLSYDLTQPNLSRSRIESGSRTFGFSSPNLGHHSISPNFRSQSVPVVHPTSNSFMLNVYNQLSTILSNLRIQKDRHTNTNDKSALEMEEVFPNVSLFCDLGFSVVAYRRDTGQAPYPPEGEDMPSLMLAFMCVCTITEIYKHSYEASIAALEQQPQNTSRRLAKALQFTVIDFHLSQLQRINKSLDPQGRRGQSLPNANATNVEIKDLRDALQQTMEELKSEAA